jgi:hypothetical protein
MIPTLAETRTEATMAAIDVSVGQRRKRVIRYDPPQPRIMPKIPPARHRTTASIRN